MLDDSQRSLNEARQRQRIERAVLQRDNDVHPTEPHFGARILAHLDDAVIVTDHRAHIVYWSPGAERLYGLAVTVAIGRPLNDIFTCIWSSDDDIETLLQTESGWQGEQIHRMRNGSECRVAVSISVQRNAAGARHSSLYLIRDTTAHYAVETRLREHVADIETLLAALPVAVLIGHDPQCTRITGNPAAARLFGMPVGSNMSKTAPVGELAREHVVRRNGRPLGLDELPMQYAAAHNVTIRDARLEIIFSDGEVKHLAGYASPLQNADGTARGVVGAYLEVSAERREEIVQQIVTRLQRELTTAADEHALLASVPLLAVPELADCCAIDMVADGATTRFAADTEPDGTPGAVSAEFVPDAIMRQVIADASPYFQPRVPADTSHAPPLRSLIIVPLQSRNTTLGAILFGMSASGRRYTPDDLQLARDVARHIALIIDNARLYAAERRARAAAERNAARNAVLAEAGSLLAAMLDYEETLQRVAALAVPRLADLCVIFVVDAGELRRVAAEHVDPQRSAQLVTLQARQPIALDSTHPAAVAIRTRRSLLNPPIADEVVDAVATTAEQAAAARALIPRSHLVVPLIGRDQAFGAISLGCDDPQRVYDSSDVHVAEELARRAAMAIENARLYNEAQAAIRVRDTFISVASHELRTPLTAALGQTQLLRKRMLQSGTASERDLRAIRVIEEQSLRLNRLLGTVLDISRLDSEQFPLLREPVDLVKLATRVTEDVYPSLDHHELAVVTSAPALVIDGDALRLEQVLQNLVHNAVKYSPAGGRVEVQLTAAGGYARVAVSDQGVGIPSDDLPRLFARFFRVEQGQSRHISGMGIGLYVVREIVRRHGGDVTVSSVEGQGSTFTVHLPLRAAE